MKTEKEIAEVLYGIEQFQNILHKIRPHKQWTIKYIPDMTDDLLSTFSNWDRERMQFMEGEEYIVVYDAEGYLLYSLNESGNSSMWTLTELFNLLGRKF